MGVQAKICTQIRQIVVGFHFLAHHVTEFGQFIARSTLQNSSIVTMCSCFLESDCRLNIVLVLSIGMKDITLHLGIAVCATTVGEDSLNIC